MNFGNVTALEKNKIGGLPFIVDLNTDNIYDSKSI